MIAPAERVRIGDRAVEVDVVLFGAAAVDAEAAVAEDENPKLLKLPPMTPAFRPATPSGLRPEKDSCSMSFASTVLRTATSVCSGGGLGGDGDRLGERAGLEREVDRLRRSGVQLDVLARALS